MTINDYNNKTYIEIIEDKVIFHRKFYKKEIKFNINNDFTFEFSKKHSMYLFKKDKRKIRVAQNIIYPKYYRKELEKLAFAKNK